MRELKMQMSITVTLIENKWSIYQYSGIMITGLEVVGELSKKKITKCDYTKFENSVQQK